MIRNTPNTSDMPITDIIRSGENHYTEFKTSFQKAVIETVVAFANTQGGQIMIGVADDGKLVGVQLNPETVKDWLNQIKNNTYPSVLPDMETHELDGKTLVLIRVTEQPIKPIAFKNRYFKRVQNSNHLMTLDEIANEHLKTINSSWDYHLDPRHDFADVSMDKVVRLIQRIEQHQQKHFDEDPFTTLQKYELVKDGKLTFAAYLLFVDRSSAITSLQIGRFKTETDIIDSLSLDTDLFTQVEEGLTFLRKHLMVEYIITGKPQREERYDYPLEALREILINMVVHRDYRDSGNSVIKIYDDRMEFFNPGKLYGDLTVAQLHSGNYSSRTRNRAIAKLFKECGMIERYGSGIRRIKLACEQHGLPEPEFEESQQGFRVILRKYSATGGVSGGVNEGLNSPDDLAQLILAQPGLNASALVHLCGKPQRTIERWLKQLKAEQKIEFRGAPKTGGYYAKSLT